MWILQVMGSGVDTAGSGKRLDATGNAWEECGCCVSTKRCDCCLLN